MGKIDGFDEYIVAISEDGTWDPWAYEKSNCCDVGGSGEYIGEGTWSSWTIYESSD